MPKLTHRIEQLTAIVHLPGGELCPLSKGSHCPHTGDNGLPFFEDEAADLERARNVPNLKKLVGCTGCRCCTRSQSPFTGLFYSLSNNDVVENKQVDSLQFELDHLG